MASAGYPNSATAPTNIFNDDEELLDDDDDEDSEDDDSISSAAAVAVDFPPPSSSTAAVVDFLAPISTVAASQVTIAVPSMPDPHLKQQQMEIVVVKKPPAQLDESRKLFQRLWTDEDEIELLSGFFEYNTQRGGTHNPSHHHDTTAFYDQIKSKFQLDFNKNQLVEKLRRLKKKYRNVISKFDSGKDYAFKTPHEQATFEISSRIWGPTVAAVNFNGYSPAFRPATMDEDDDDPNNLGYQSPNPNGIDVNSKTPRLRKRNRAGAIKVEDKMHQHAINNNTINNHPPMAATPIATPVMGAGIAGSISGVIEETVKSCLSPIFKELLVNSMSSSQNPNGASCGPGFGLALSPMPLGFAGLMGGDKMIDVKWRKQQILELEVFSKRLELVQEQINEQLQELRSMGN